MKKGRPTNFGPIRVLNVASCNLCNKAKVKGQIELKIEEILHIFGEIGQAISNLVAVLKFIFRFMGYGSYWQACKDGTVFDNLPPS